MKRLYNAFWYSWAGLVAAFKDEAAFRQEILLSLIAFILLFVLPLALTEKMLMGASMFLVLIVELINSAIEAIIDRVSAETHPLSKKAKDIGSAAVLLALLNAAFVWGICLFVA